jgi:hypothetical protein
MRRTTLALFIACLSLSFGCGRVKQETPGPLPQGGSSGAGGRGGSGGVGGGTGGGTGGVGGSMQPPAPDGSAADSPGPDRAPDSVVADAKVADTSADLAVDAATPDQAADTTPDQPPSPCPSAAPPPGYGLQCGCAGDGKIQCSGSCDKPDDTCIPTGQFYVLTNNFLGETRRLDTYSGGMSTAFMSMQAGASGQFWNITALGDGSYRLTNMFLGATRSLEASSDGAKLIMGNTGDVPAQKWRIRAISAGVYRFTNGLHGAARSLDTRNDTANDPFMTQTANYSGQYWKVTKTP